MINEEKVILMTKLASYEKRDEDKYRNIDSYFRGDYIILQVMKSIVAATIAFLLCFVMYILFHYEELLQNIYQIDLKEFFLQKVLVSYAIMVGSCAVFSYLLSAWKFHAAKKSLKNFYQNLKKLSAFYQDNKS